MPRFRFALEPLLTARRRAEQEKQRAVAHLERERASLEDTLRRQQEGITTDKQALAGGLVGTLDLGLLRGQAAATIHRLRRAQRVVLELAGVHRRLEGARTELLEAARDRRAVELLREKRFDEWRRGIERAEAAALDELAVQAAARKETRR